MQRTRWLAVGVVVPTIAALGIACDQRTPTEVQRLSARQAGATLERSDDRGLTANPFVFVGTAEECGVAGSPIVTSAWLDGMGLPDGGDESLNVSANPDRREGLLLNKNGLTADCSSAGAVIHGFGGMEIDATFALGFDYRNGGHCGAGAPRFNVVVEGEEPIVERRFFLGCFASVQTPAPQDIANWTRARMTAPPAILGRRIESISIVHDEGTDVPIATATSQDLSGVGLAILDNIFVNGRFIRRGNGIAQSHVRQNTSEP